jgi:hypothetical protein
MSDEQHLQLGRDDILEVVERMANPITPFPDGKNVGAGQIAAAVKAVQRLQQMIEESRFAPAPRP